MIWFFIILSIIFLLYIIFTSNKKIINERIIFSPHLNESYIINNMHDETISKIQLSLNNRDNVFNIKNNKLYENNKIVIDLIRM